MKQAYQYLFLLLCVVGLAACSDNDNELQGSSLSILQSDVIFQARGGTGFVELSGGDFTARADKEWCDVRTNGHRVEVTVSQNIEVSERTALIILTPADGTAPVQLTVMQVAPVFEISSVGELKFFGNDEVKELEVQSSLDVTVEADDEWLEYEVIDNRLIRLHCLKSDTPLRSTQVRISSGKMVVTLNCSQMCIEGEYNFNYTDADWDEYDLPATLVRDPQDETSYILHVEGLPYGRDLRMKFENEKLAFHAGQYLGVEEVDGTDYHLFLTCGYGRITPTWDPVVDYVAPLEQNKKGEFFYEFIDNKHWDGGKFLVSRLSFSTFNDRTPSSDSFVAELDRLAYVIMTVKKIY